MAYECCLLPAAQALGESTASSSAGGEASAKGKAAWNQFSSHHVFPVRLSQGLGGLRFRVDSCRRVYSYILMLPVASSPGTWRVRGRLFLCPWSEEQGQEQGQGQGEDCSLETVQQPRFSS